ncbi:MAG: hypothetical protein IJ091_09430, partial [Oscillospiraceae bacterium]|nr:hypothetical protein [Oscillospiraceae bacterium]
EGKAVIKLYYPKADQVVLMLKRRPWPMVKEGDYFVLETDLENGIQPVVVMVDGSIVVDSFLPVGIGHNQPFNFVDFVSDEDPWAEKTVPHGSLQSWQVFNSVTGKTDRLLVYVPAYYFDHPEDLLDVLFLQHGFGENETSWLSEGKIDNIVDNLIADGKIRPLLVVMATGMMYKTEGEDVLMLHSRFNEYLKHDIFPVVKKQYRCGDYYMAGLSMGSIQTSITVLEDPEMFKGAGLFSGFLSDPISGYSDHLAPERLKVFCEKSFLMRGIGDTDRFLPIFEKEDALMSGITHERKIYHGEHEWNVWREMIVDFLMLREKYNAE